MTARVRIVFAHVLAVLAILSVAGRATAQVPVDDVEVIIAIDTSESMEPAIGAAKQAARSFVDAMPDGVRIGIETFADTVTVLTPPIADRAEIGARIDAITTGGDTALYDLVVGAPSHFTPTVEHKVLVVLSDGKDEGSAAALADAIAAAETMQVESISLTTSSSDLESLSALGPVTPADDATGLAAAFDRVAGLIVEVIAPTTAATTTTAVTTTTAAPTTVPVTSGPPTTVPATTAAAVAPPASLPPPSDESAASGSSSLVWIGGGALFAGVFLLVLLLFPQQRVSKARLGVDKPRTASDFGVRTISAIDEALERHGRRSSLGNSLTVADIGTQPAEFVALVLVVAAVAGSVGLLLGGPLLGVAAAAAVCLGVWAYVARTKAKRRAAFADQLPDVLQLLSTALRSGFGLTQALESVAEDAEEPARGEFARVLAQARLGRDLSEAMYALADRMESKDLEWIVGAIDINRESGGNLAEVLETVGETIRERGRLARHVRTLTAEGRLSARILTGLPFLMLLWQWRVNPDNFELLTYGAGLAALVLAGILMLLGSLWVFRLVKSVSL